MVAQNWDVDTGFTGYLQDSLSGFALDFLSVNDNVYSCHSWVDSFLRCFQRDNLMFRLDQDRTEFADLVAGSALDAFGLVDDMGLLFLTDDGI